MSPKDTAYIVERLAVRFMAMVAEYERKLLEHRDAFGVRTSADAKIIEGLRQQIETLNREERAAHDTLEPLVDRVVKERDGLLTQVRDQRAEIERLRNDERKAYQDGDALRVERDSLRAEVAALQERLRASIARGDFAEIEVAQLKTQTSKRSHPVKDGEYVVRTKLACAHFGHVAKVIAFIAPCSYEVQCIEGRGIWYFHNCEPCDPPTEATHDTPAGKKVAESAAKTEPVADEIKVGDLVEVVSNRGRNTWLADVGSLGTVTSVEEINESISVQLDDVPGKKNALAGYVSFCDVRKVPQ